MQMPKQPGVIPPKVAGSALPAKPLAIDEGGWANGNGWGSSWDDWNSTGWGKGKDGKGKRGKGKGKGDDLEVVVKGLPSSTDEASLQAYFASCGEITRVSIPRAKDGLPKGAAFVGFTTQEGVNKALLHDKTLYLGSICISVRPSSEKHEGRGKKRSNDDLTVVIKGFPDHTDEASLTAFFASCGEIVRVNLPRNKHDGKLKAAGFIEFKTQEGFNTAPCNVLQCFFCCGR